MRGKVDLGDAGLISRFAVSLMRSDDMGCGALLRVCFITSI